MIRADLGKRLWNLRIILIVLFILHSTVSRYFEKDNRVLRVIPRCLRDVACITLSNISNISNTSNIYSGGMQYYFRFSTKSDFLYLLFLKIWVKPHFPLKRPSLFSSRAEVFLSWIKKNKKLSSENSNAFEDDLSDRSLIYIKNNNGSSDALGNTCFNIKQVRDFPFIKTLGFLFLRKSQRFSELPDIPFAFYLKIGSLFQTLSNIFDISRKIPLTLKSS